LTFIKFGIYVFDKAFFVEIFLQQVKNMDL
jgi:hypothetical protein